MNKSIFLAILGFVGTVHTMEQPERLIPMGSGSSRSYQTMDDLERGTMEAFILSTDLPELSKEYCDQIIACAPSEVRDCVKVLKHHKNIEKILPYNMVLYGAIGSGKTALARVIAQEMQMPFVIVEGELLGSDRSDFAISALNKASSFCAKNKANLIIDKFDCVAKKKDQTSSVLCHMLDMAEINKLLFIGTARDVRGMPEQLQSGLQLGLYEIFDSNELKLHSAFIKSCFEKTTINNEKSIERLIEETRNFSHRDMVQVVKESFFCAKSRDNQSPIITDEDIQFALNKVKMGRRSLQQAVWDKKQIFNYTIQTIGTAVHLMSILMQVFTIPIPENQE